MPVRNSKTYRPIKVRSPEIVSTDTHKQYREKLGFDQQYAEGIFSTFTRLNSKDKYDGTRLGPALCKKIAERHGGAISAKSEKNSGAEFTVVLPYLDYI